MIKKIICVGVILVIAFSLIGCTYGRIIQFEVEEGFYTENKEDHPNLLELVKSVEELELLCDEYGLINDAQKYDNEFFAENALVLYLFGDSAYTFDFKAVRVKNEVMVISVTRSHSTIDEATLFSYFIKIKKADIEGISNVQIDMKIKTR